MAELPQGLHSDSLNALKSPDSLIRRAVLFTTGKSDGTSKPVISLIQSHTAENGRDRI